MAAMTEFRIIVYFLSCLFMMGSSEVVNLTCSFVWTADPCGDTCKGKCTTNEDCHILDVTMKCVSGWCTCKDNAPYVHKCLYSTRIGQECTISDECTDAGGYCDGGVCACYDNTVEFRESCYKGYKALLTRQLTLDIEAIEDLAFWVSDKDEQYQILSNGVEAEYTFNFNALDVWSTDSQNEASMWRTDNKGECGLCAILFAPTSNINSIKVGGLYYEMGILTYDEGTDSFDELCNQVNGILSHGLTQINVTRNGDQATADIEFHPLSHEVSLVTGFLGDSCTDNDDCKPLGSVCDGDSCACDANHIEVTTDYCAPKIDGLSSSCSVYDQCTVSNAVCSGASKCECKSGYKEIGGACVSSS